MKRSKDGVVNLGEFDMESGVARISDPCYDKTVWCAGTIDKVKTGTWKAVATKNSEGRISKLYAYHKDHKVELKSNNWKSEKFEVGVDSGQVGIYDEKYFRDDKLVKNIKRINKTNIICEDEPWYSICCDRTLNSKNRADIIPYGVVSSSGYGDGIYCCCAVKEKGKIVAIAIDFELEE